MNAHASNHNFALRRCHKKMDVLSGLNCFLFAVWQPDCNRVPPPHSLDANCDLASVELGLF